MTNSEFGKIVDLVVSNFEGGYYHPDMLADGRVSDPRYASSGETMFGIDRLHGGVINTSAAGQKFWSLIDNADARHKWNWNYMGGSLQGQLKSLVGSMLHPVYEQYANKYLSPKAKRIVDRDPRLTMHFAYATWNGEGWFKKFANDINKAVENGTTEAAKLSEVAIDSRTKEGYTPGSAPNSLIAQQGEKMGKLFQSKELLSLKNVAIIGGVLLFVIAGTLILVAFNKKKIEQEFA